MTRLTFLYTGFQRVVVVAWYVQNVRDRHLALEQVKKNILAQTLLFPVTAAASDTEAVGSATVRLSLGL